MINKIVLLLTVVLTASCSHPIKYTKGNYQHIAIKDENIGNIKRLSEIIDTVQYIPLETKEDCLIGRIKKVKYFDGQFYVYDEIANALFLFDEVGRFLTKYSKIGKGPFEYLEIEDIEIDSVGNCYVLDTRKIIKLDRGLNPVDEIRLPFGTLALGVYKDGFAVAHYGIEEEVSMLNQNGSVISSYLPFHGIPRMALSKPFIKVKDKLLFTPVNVDTIFSINADSISVHVVIDFEKPTPDDFFSASDIKKQGLFAGIIPDAFMHGIRDYCETDDFIQFRFSYDYKNYDGPFCVLYSKKANNAIIYTNETENDVYLSIYVPIIRDVTPDGNFIAVIEAGMFCESVKNQHKELELDERLSKVTELSNPVIALVTFKNKAL